MVSLGIIFYFCLYKTQENIKNNIFIMVLSGGIVKLKVYTFWGLMNSATKTPL